jgi:hypothetical protein
MPYAPSGSNRNRRRRRRRRRRRDTYTVRNIGYYMKRNFVHFTDHPVV